MTMDPKWLRLMITQERQLIQVATHQKNMEDRKYGLTIGYAPTVDLCGILEEGSGQAGEDK